jgi:3-oxoacyl-[acyl-carrier-protein] synthase II
MLSCGIGLPGQSAAFGGEAWKVTIAREEESMRRVVVTGLGMVAATGNSVSQAWEAALAGRSAVGRISLFDASDFPVQIAAEVRDFDPSTVMSLKEARQSSRFVQFAAAAAREALGDSGLDVNTGSDRYGCAIGVGLGAIGKIEQGAYTCRDRGPRRVSPHFLPYVIPNMAAGFVSVALGLRGPNFSMATACASGTHAIGEAFLHVAMGTADAMVAGGTEATISPLCVAAFAKMRALSTRNDDPAEASRPFDLDRDGFVMGEGSGLIVIEELEHAKQRGARIYAEVVGYGLSGDGHHITSPTPDGDGAARCMAGALKSGQIDPEQIDHINAHGTSTKANDASESTAITTVLGDHATQVSINSTKGVTGHCLGAAGGIEAIYTVLAIHHSVVPPTANYTTPDPDCPLDYTTDGARERSIRYALSNSVGFGGQNACLAFSGLF